MTDRIYRIEVWETTALPKRTLTRHKLYFVSGALNPEHVDQLAANALVDPVTEQYVIGVADLPSGATHWIDVTFRPGVTDPAGDSLIHAAHVLGIDGLERAATGTRFVLFEKWSSDDLESLANTEFANPLIQRYCIDTAIDAPFVAVDAVDETVETIAIRGLDDEHLLAISAERRLSLDLNEMRAIRDYFQGIERDPTDAELEMLAQTWSEHCVHKTFKAKITYTGPVGADPNGEIMTQMVDGLLNTYIRAATETVNKPWVRSAFVDNAGIVKFNDDFDLAFKVETHNRPSALEPFGGANTGAGGVIRDVLGVSARPIANTDILFFGPPDLPDEHVPEGVIHPKRVAAGVVAGIEDYGNKMGIPTVSGAIHYDRRYTSNPLVFAGCLGILPRGSHPTNPQPGDLIVVIGGRTGRDGLRGATFSSMEMDTTTSELSGGAVQIGHPIQEKQVQEAVLRARDEKLYNAITDCGAGGLSSAVGEMGEKIGATVHLDRVSLKYPGLRPWEIWLSEAQERMVLAVPESNWARLQAICEGQDVEAVNIGAFDPTGQLRLLYNGNTVGDVSMHFLHEGIPQREMIAEWTPPVIPTKTAKTAHEDCGETLLKLLAMPTIRSKEEVIRRYDHEVQGGTAIKPLVGVRNAGPSDATVIVPQGTATSDGEPVRGVALSVGTCPQYSDLDPYAMAWAAVDEAVRNLVAVGVDPDTISILDNFSWGNTNMPDRLGSLVRAAQGCHDAAVAYGLPFISGKDSLNNEYLGADGKRHAIPGTLVISAMGIVPDVTNTVTMDLKESGNLMYVIGETRDEMGGSHYNLLHRIEGGVVPQPNPDAMQTYRVLHQAIKEGLVASCHDVSEGGLAVALAEMCIAGRLGVQVDVCGLVPGLYDASESNPLPWDNLMTFAESGTRMIIEVRPENREGLENLLATKLPNKSYEGMCGRVHDKSVLTMNGCDSDVVLSVPISSLEKSWRGVTQVGTQHAASLRPSKEHGNGLRTTHNKTQTPKVIILHANGTNRDHDAYLACEMAGSTPEIVHINQLLSGERIMLDYHMLVVPGGFSYGDDLGAGVLWSLDLRERFGDALQRFVQDGRPVFGICNGFQTLVKAGVLPGNDWSGGERMVTLTFNERAQFECRWVYLEPNPACPSLFTQGLDELLYVPVAHGEGRVMVQDASVEDRLVEDNLIGLRYVSHSGDESADYPDNPNGSVLGIAGLSNAAGNVFGLMPHPENHVFPWQHPRYHRGERGMDGLRLFKNGIKFA